MQESHPDVDEPQRDELELDPEVLGLRWAEPDPKAEMLRWIGNGAERAAFVAMGVWYAVAHGWFESGLVGIPGLPVRILGALLVAGGCLAVGAAVRRRRPDLFEEASDNATPAVGGW